MIENLVTPSDKIIIELNRHQIEFMASMTHWFLRENKENPTAISLLKELNLQTDYVHMDPVKHGIRPLITKPSYPSSSEEWGTKAMELDLTGLTGLFFNEGD